MRRSKKSVTGNLDSLLDTVANVVGIMVILLTVTQLNVKETVKRIHQKTEDIYQQITFESLEEAKQESEQIRHKLIETNNKWNVLQKSIAKSVTEIQRIKEKNNDPKESVENTTKGIQELKLEISDLNIMHDELKKSYNNIRANLPPPKILYIPDPRPAPRNTDDIFFFCRYGRIVKVDLEYLFDIVLSAMQNALRVTNTRSATSIFEYLERADLASAYFKWELIKYGGNRGYERLSWRHRQIGGESGKDIQRSGSDFLRALTQGSSNKIIKYYVWSDSFDVYLAARQISDKRGYSAGWTPLRSEKELIFSVKILVKGGEFRFIIGSAGGRYEID